MPIPKSNTFDAVLLVMQKAAEAQCTAPINMLQCFLNLSPQSQRKLMFGLISKDQTRQRLALWCLTNGRYPADIYSKAKNHFRTIPISDDFEKAHNAYAVLHNINNTLDADAAQSTQALYTLMLAFNSLCYEQKKAIREKLQKASLKKEGYIDLMIASGLIYKAHVSYP